MENTPRRKETGLCPQKSSQVNMQSGGALHGESGGTSKLCFANLTRLFIARVGTDHAGVMCPQPAWRSYSQWVKSDLKTGKADC